jgi:hypothetical protein
MVTPVQCCWNGMAALNAEPFKRGLRFRAQIKGECRASECSLLCDDFQKLGYRWGSRSAVHCPASPPGPLPGWFISCAAGAPPAPAPPRLPSAKPSRSLPPPRPRHSCRDVVIDPSVRVAYNTELFERIHAETEPPFYHVYGPAQHRQPPEEMPAAFKRSSWALCCPLPTGLDSLDWANPKCYP